MRIAFISTVLAYPWGGADKLWTQAAEEASARGIQLLIAVAPQTATHPRIQALKERGAMLHLRRGFTTITGHISRWRTAWQRWSKHPDSLVAALDGFAPDLVIISQGGPFDFVLENELVAWLQEREQRFALICQSNGEEESLDPARQAEARAFVNRAQQFVFVSTHNRTLAEKQLGGPLRRAVVIQNPVDETPATPLPWPTDDTPRFAVVARLETHVKGLDLAIDALAAALPRDSDWSVDIFGRGPDEAAIRDRIARAELSGRVTLRGFQPSITSVWEDHHILLLPSRREGCSLAMLEALACGRPAIVTPTGGAAEWVQDGENGFVASGCSTQPLVDTLQRAWAVRTSWKNLGAAAYRSFVRHHDPQPGQTLLKAVLGAISPA